MCCPAFLHRGGAGAEQLIRDELSCQQIMLTSYYSLILSVHRCNILNSGFEFLKCLRKSRNEILTKSFTSISFLAAKAAPISRNVCSLAS